MTHPVLRQQSTSWLRAIIHLLGITPLALILLAGLTHSLSFNPIQDIEQRLGRAALYFLVASLAITPLTTLTGWPGFLPRRRTLGLYSFLYACLHFLTFVALDYGFDFQEIGRLVIEKPYIYIGLSTGVLLVILTITSIKRITRKLGRWWKPIQRLVYLAGGLAILHYAWAEKGDIFNLRGNILKPVLWGVLLVLLLTLRLPFVRKSIVAVRQDFARRRNSKQRFTSET
jgi:methionine sulfoxide reductase heme-binding subunit